eukprot:6185072-Pleurochrysis_carterae.AAC.4
MFRQPAQVLPPFRQIPILFEGGAGVRGLADFDGEGVRVPYKERTSTRCVTVNKEPVKRYYSHVKPVNSQLAEVGKSKSKGR